jgi:hypothetical protein
MSRCRRVITINIKVTECEDVDLIQLALDWVSGGLLLAL